MPKKKKARRQKSGEMDYGEFIRQLEELIVQFGQTMHEAVLNNDPITLESNTRAWTQAQGLWLQHTQGMSVEKAKAVLIGFATANGEFAKWENGKSPGPPPTVLTLYTQKEKEADDV